MSRLAQTIDAETYASPEKAISALIRVADLSAKDRAAIHTHASTLVERLRRDTRPGLMEVFLAEYGLSSDEGVALMCLAEALLRVPDAATIDALIEDKIAASDWGKHLGHSTSRLVNASTWALVLTGRVLEEAPPGPVGHLRNAIKRLGEPVIRTAVSRAMKEMGRQFVLGESIEAAMTRATTLEDQGYTYSYDMLGEAALTHADALRYFQSYKDAIAAIAQGCKAQDIRENPGISVKLSALHPRYERTQAERVLAELLPRIKALCLEAKAAGMGLNIDAEEADRLALSFDVIQALVVDPDLSGWNGLGIVIQAYSQRASTVIDAIYALAEAYDSRLIVRLVKGAYWDTEIKRAQVTGVAGFPVFTRKAQTDVSYIACARQLLGYADRIYPQFATHNAHTVASILHMAKDEVFEFQRLHGMGEALHDLVMQDHGTRCRVYAPVGAHKDLLAYLVRRLLENGANSSFVNQIVDPEVPPSVVAADPFDALQERAPALANGPALFAPERRNAHGFDLAHLPTLDEIDAERDRFRAHRWEVAPRTATPCSEEAWTVINPADASDKVGTVHVAPEQSAIRVMSDAKTWDAPLVERRTVLERASDLYEAHYGEIFALLAREAGKTLPDAVSELREAVDFLRYYAAQATETNRLGTVICISPWNFPLAIFTGQIAAALAVGNAVVAKPAEQTPLIADLAVRLLHEAGVPDSALQLVLGGRELGAALTAAQPDGVAFTGSTATALSIRRSLARHGRPGTPLIAETGGLNAMIVDSTALPEQAVRSVVESAFQSAGQRCSALRCLYVQEDIAQDFLEMLTGAMDALKVGHPWHLSTDVGPVIDEQARSKIAEHIAKARHAGRLIHEVTEPTEGTFVAPCLIEVDGIETLEEEVFGPVLHVATFTPDRLDAVVEAINGTGYGLTFGLHTRMDDRVNTLSRRVEAGNVYVNRNQIGAVVGSQPFGGTGLSGTGPKAGGPDYLSRFAQRAAAPEGQAWSQSAVLPELPLQTSKPHLTVPMPGPTGEANTLSSVPKAHLLCAGPGPDAAAAQARAVADLGGVAVVAQGQIEPSDLSTGPAYGGVVWWGDEAMARALETALAERDGQIITLIRDLPDRADVMSERHLCVDTTAAGGNTDLLGAHG